MQSRTEKKANRISAPPASSLEALSQKASLRTQLRPTCVIPLFALSVPLGGMQG